MQTISDLSLWGPLAALSGEWEGDKGDDTAPSDDRGTEKNRFRERMIFTPMSRVDNHEQTLYGLRYSTTAWRIGEADPFHEELGYWLWDGKAKEVYRCFLVPRGVSVLAGGRAEANAKEFSLTAEAGNPVFGISSNPFLDREFKTVRYEFTLKFIDDKTIHYEEDTQLRIKGQNEVFHHIDKNTLRRV